MFGELALLDASAGKRKARITCKDDCVFATLHRAQFKQNIEKIEKRQHIDKFEYFKDLPFMNGIHRVRLSGLMPCFNKTFFKHG